MVPGASSTAASSTATIKATMAGEPLAAAGSLFLIITVAFQLWTLFQLMTHWNIDTLLSEYEKTGQAHTEHYSKTYNFDEGPHNVWAGMQTDAFGVALWFGFAYAAGMVKSITIDGIAPPETPVLYYPDNTYAGQSIEFRPYGHDQNDDPIQYILNWGDGSAETVTDFFPSQTEGQVEHTYLNQGTYTITIYAKDCDRMESETNTYQVIVTGGDSDEPTVSITSPENYLYLNGRKLIRVLRPVILLGGIEIKADAYDQGSGIKQVEFIIDGKTEHIDETFPYEYQWDDRGIGNYNLMVRALDNSGKTSTESKKVFYFNPTG